MKKTYPPAPWGFSDFKNLGRGATECHLDLFNTIQRRATRLVGHAKLTSQLAPLDGRRRVASLSLFYQFFHGYCASGVTELMPQSAEIGRPLINRAVQHPYRVHRYHVCTDTPLNSFVAQTSREKNSFPRSVFPLEYDLQSFKRKVNNLID